MRLFPATLVTAVYLIASPVIAGEPSALTYEDSIRCATINVVFSGTEEDESSDAAKQYENAGTAFLVHAFMTGGKSEEAVNADFDSALEQLFAKMEDDATPEGFLEPHAVKCAELEVENAELFAEYGEE